MTSNGGREEIQKNVFQIPNKSRITRRDSREDTGHPSALETKRNGMELAVLQLKENGIPQPHMMERFKETSKQTVFKSIGALNRGILKNNRDIIHFNADASNTELFFRTIHSANQLSIYGAVSSWCEEFGLRPNERELTSERFVAKENEQLRKNVKLEEVNSMVQTPRSDDPASGKSLHDGFGESNSSMQRVYAPSC